MSGRRLVLLAACVAVLALLAAAAWRALPSASEGEVLVLADRAFSGPIRVFTSPFGERAVVRARIEESVEVPLALGEGASWPLSARVTLRVDPQALDGAARRALLAGELGASIRERARTSVEVAVASAGTERVLGRPASLADPLSRELSRDLPAGLAIEGVEVRVDAPPEQARAAAMASARRALREPLARVLYIGLDGMDWEILGPLLAKGELPAFGRIVREGVRTEIIAYEPMISPLLWTTAVTGRGPDEHGVADFVVQGADGKALPISSAFRKAPALWEILTAAGQGSGFVNFWATQPPESVDGVLVSDVADRLVSEPDRTLPLPAGLAAPRSFLDDLAAELYTTDTFPAEKLRVFAPALTDAEITEARLYWRDRARRDAWKAAHSEDHERKTPIPAFLLKTATHVANQERLTLELLRDSDLGTVGVYFREPDESGHNFQHLAPPPHPLAPPEERARFAEVVENCYRVLDGVVGRLIAAAGPDTVVLIHSDHGFRWGGRRPTDVSPFATGQPVEWHRLQGVFLAAGGPVRRNATVPPVTMFEIAPTILALRGVPPDESMPGKVRADLLDPAAAERLPRERIPSWTALVPPRRFEDASEEELEAAQEQMVEALKGLGYVDDRAGGGKAPAEGPASAAGEPGEQRPQVMYHRNLATWLMNENRFADAERELLRANEVEKLAKTYWLLSEARAARGDLRGARQALEEGFRETPGEMTPDAVLWLVEISLRENDAAGAESALASHAKQLGKSPAVRAVAEGRIAEQRGDTARARALYLEALGNDPRQTRAAERFAALAASPAERATLAPYLERGLALDSRIELYWKMLGLIRIERGDAGSAIEALTHAAELEPNDEEVAMTLGTALLRAGRTADARRVYERLAGGGSTRPAVWVNLGSLRAQAGDWPGARAAWERAASLGADSPQLRQGLEEARRRAGS